MYASVTLAAVFAPISFSSGRTGRLFVEFALTLAGAVMVSGFIALTLSPMMCSRWLKPHSAQESNWSKAIDRFLHGLDERYKARLERVRQANQVVDQALPPDDPLGRKRVQKAMLGAGMGFIGMSLIALMWESRSRMR